jgi:hypothetical protein
VSRRTSWTHMDGRVGEVVGKSRSRVRTRISVTGTLRASTKLLIWREPDMQHIMKPVVGYDGIFSHRNKSRMHAARIPDQY